jgi:hypothetical protein
MFEGGAGGGCIRSIRPCLMKASRPGIMKRGVAQTKLKLANGLGGLPLARFVDLDGVAPGSIRRTVADVLAQLFDSFGALQMKVGHVIGGFCACNERAAR